VPSKNLYKEVVIFIYFLLSTNYKVIPILLPHIVIYQFNNSISFCTKNLMIIIIITMMMMMVK